MQSPINVLRDNRRRAYFWVYLALGAAIVTFLATDPEGLSLRLDAAPVAVWALLVVGLALGKEFARLSLIAYGLVCLLLLGLLSNGHRDEPAFLVLAGLMASQTAVLLWPSLRRVETA